MNLLSYLFRQSKMLVLISALTGLVGGLSGAALVAVISKGLNATSGDQLATLTWVFFGLCLLHLAAKSVSEISLLNLTQSAVCQMRVALSRKLLATPMKRLQELGKPGLLVIMTKDIEAFTTAFQFLPIAFGNSIVITCCFSYLAWLSWQMFLLLTLFLLVGVMTFHFAERGPIKHLNKVRELTDILYQRFRDLIEGSKELQLNMQRGDMFVEKVISPDAQDFKQSFISSMIGYTWLMNMGTIMFYLVIGILLFVVPLWAPQPAGVATTVIVTLLYLVRPISELVMSLPVVRQAGIALQRIQQLNQELADVEPKRLEPGADPFSVLPAVSSVGVQPWVLELRDIRHHYPSGSDDSHFMLGPMDLTINQGEILYIVGGNGSGKTTLAMLILGLYRPDAGTIALNGTIVTEANTDYYRQHFSAVFADFHLFEHLLDTNNQQSLGERAAYYIKVLGMEHKVKVVDGKFSTINLSTGQRKRLALVSSYLEDRPIYMFDEWAADQDPTFKRVFYTELLPELKSRGKTVIIITHDDAYFSYADRILKLEDGHQRKAQAQNLA